MTRGLVAAACWLVTAWVRAAVGAEGAPTVVATATVEGEVRIEVTNDGPAPLRNVFPVLEVGGTQVELPAREELPAGAKAEWTERVAARQGAAEAHPVAPLVLRVFYADPTWYLASVPVVVPAEPASATADGPVEDRIEVRPAAGRASIVLRVTNRTNDDLNGNVTLVLPAELSADGGSRALHIRAGESVEAQYGVRTAGARPGTRQRVYALLRLDGAGEPRTDILSAAFTVRRSDEDERRIWLELAGAAALVVGLFLLTAWLETGETE